MEANQSRRGFLRGALALPAIAAVAATPAAEAATSPGEGMALFKLHGELLLVDVNTYELDGDVEALVIGADGKIRIENAKIYDGHKFAGERSGIATSRPRWQLREGVVILGRVVRPNATALAIEGAA